MMFFFWHQLKIHMVACNHDTYVEYYHMFGNRTPANRGLPAGDRSRPPHRGQEKEAQEVAEDGAIICHEMGVSKNRGTPKWMAYNGKPLLKWMIWGYHFFFGNTQMHSAIELQSPTWNAHFYHKIFWNAPLAQ